MKKIILLFVGLTLAPSFLFAQWQQASGPYSGTVKCMAVDGTNVYAGTTGSGMFLSSNNGLNWAEINDGLANFEIRSIAISGTSIFAGTYGGGIYLSSNGGANWNPINTGLSSTSINALAIIGSNIFAGTWGGGVFLSTNNGSSWTAINTGLANLGVLCFAINGSNIYAGTNGGVYLSTNNGSSWSAINAGLNFPIYSLIVHGSNIYAGTGSNGVYVSSNNGTSWMQVNNGLNDHGSLFKINTLFSYGTEIYAGTDGAGLYSSSDNGATWNPKDTGLNFLKVLSIVNMGTDILVGTDGGGIHMTPNFGINWMPMNSGLKNTIVYSLACDSTKIFAGTIGNVFLSQNCGSSWSSISNGLGNQYVEAITFNSDYLYAGTNSGVFRSSDNGLTWALVKPGGVLSITDSGSRVFAGSSSGYLYVSDDNGTTWVSRSVMGGGNVNCIAMNGASIFVGTDYGVFLSSNSGLNWVMRNTGLTSTVVYSIAFGQGSDIYVATENGVFFSSNSGVNWAAVNSGLTTLEVWSLLVLGDTIFAGTDGGGVFLSTNNGASWLPCNAQLEHLQITSLATDGNYVFAGTVFGGIYRRLISDFNFQQVWPGDANNDSLVNNNDLLSVGLNYGASGIPRDSISNLWIGHDCAEWSILQPDYTNMKHADCNGDGMVNSLDTVAINLNYGFAPAYKKSNAAYEKDVNSLIIVPVSTSMQAGDTARFDIMAGNFSNPVLSLYGISYNIQIDPLFIEPGTIRFAHVSSWLGDVSSGTLTLSKVFCTAGIIENAIIRTDHINQGGFGRIGRLEFVINSCISDTDTMHLSISYYKAVTADGQNVPFTIDSASIEVLPQYTYVNQSSSLEFSIYPNPVKDILHITSLNKTEIKIVNFQGQLVRNQFSTGEYTSIDISDLPAGMYFLYLKGNDNFDVKRFVKE